MVQCLQDACALEQPHSIQQGMNLRNMLLQQSGCTLVVRLPLHHVPDGECLRFFVVKAAHEPGQTLHGIGLFHHVYFCHRNIAREKCIAQ